MTARPPTVIADDLVISYAEVRAVRGASFEACPGEVVGLLGGNGAGKSSTLRALAGVNPPTAGRLLIDGHDMSRPSEAEQARAVLGYTPDVGGLIRQATVREHLALALGSRGRLDEMPYALTLIEEFRLSEVLDRETSGFSHGMSRRLSVALAALTATKVLALDEPFDGVDPLGVHATEAVISRARDAGLAVLVSTHLLPLLVGVSDRILVMREGVIVETGPALQYAGDVGAERYESLLRAT